MRVARPGSAQALRGGVRDKRRHARCGPQMLICQVDAGFACSSISIQAGQVFAVKVGYSHPARLDALIKNLSR